MLPIVFTITTLGGLGCTGPNISKGEPRPADDPTADPNAPENTDTGNEVTDSGDMDEQPCGGGVPTLEIGTGETEFEAIDHGSNIEVIHGAQDGHHILGSLRTQNTTEITVVRFQIIPTTDGVAISDQTYRLLMLPDPSGEPCTWNTIGMYAYLGRIDPGEASFLLNTVLIQMDLVDDYGREVSQSLEVIPFLNPVEHGTSPPESTD